MTVLLISESIPRIVVAMVDWKLSKRIGCNSGVKVIQKNKETNHNRSRISKSNCSYNYGLSCPIRWSVHHEAKSWIDVEGKVWLENQ